VPGERRIRPPAWRQRGVVAVVAAGVAVLLAGVLLAAAAFGDDDEPESAAASVEVVTVPAVVGLRTRPAEAALERAGLGSAIERKASRRPPGTVLAAKPKAGSRVERGVAILLVVSGGRSAPTTTDARPAPPPPPSPSPPVEPRPSDTVVVEPEPELSEVPGVLEVGYVDSARMIEDRGFVAETIPVRSSRPRGLVLRQEPPPGTPLARGRVVRLYVALGRGSRGAIRLVDHTGFPERQARELLERAGFTVRTVDRTAPSRRLIGRVLRQSPGAPGRLPVLSQVTLYVGR
jgi:beta-lactam-binding protein with PASTA domain